MSFEQLISNIKSYAKQVYNQDNNADKRELARVDYRIENILNDNHYSNNEENKELFLNRLLEDLHIEARRRTHEQLHKQFEKDGIPVSTINSLREETHELSTRVYTLEQELSLYKRRIKEQIRKSQNEYDEAKQFYEDIMDNIKDGTYKLTT